MFYADTSADTLFARAFADQCHRWARDGGAGDAACHAARMAGYRLVLAAQKGDVCIELSAPDMPNVPDAVGTPNLTDLAASGLLDTPETRNGRPMVVDAAGRLYLARYFMAETALAASLIARHRHLPSPPGPAAREMLARLFPATSPHAAPDAQKLAVALALLRRFVVLSGGPGTGKTSTIARLLACLLAESPNLRIALAAPTGKAAARMQESLRERARDLPGEIAARLPREAFTLHHLLGLSAHDARPRHHAGNPLPCDALVVDEASMLDLTLAEQLLAALPAHARLILLGDKAQLQAVEAGSVFATLSGKASLSDATRQRLADLADYPPALLERAPYFPAAPAHPLQDAVIWL
ncbi:MAG: AAA family ATPase, partial [Zoogloeaceae bacterium]|nr:AAA family ATPase [Zoogloeaceae bacterium]